MTIKGIIKKGEYFDSVSLMLVAKDVNKLAGINDSGVVMGTAENKSILKASGIFIEEFNDAKDSDLLVVVKAEKDDDAVKAIAEIENLFKKLRQKSGTSQDFKPKSLSGAIKAMPDANLSLISVAGKYAAVEAMKALQNNMHVMLFSDNVSIEDELKLKNTAIEKGLLVMGPDCGTAIINGTPIAFANVVGRGNIGIVAASGTGLQEVSCVISNEGAGISQAIGTGGRDVKKEIGGLMFLEAMRALQNDDATKIIVLVSKPPHPDVQQKIAEEIKKITKPVVAILIGGNPEVLKNAGAITASTLEEAGVFATALSMGKNISDIEPALLKRKENIIQKAKQIATAIKGKYVRGLFSGGTLCDETQLILKETVGFVYSNTPLGPDFKLADVWKSKENTIIDLGDDEFTVGRPHPMIDFSLRKKKIIEEAKDKDTAIILLDVVLGYGSNPDPAPELVPSITEALKISPRLKIICSITGTENDPQNKASVKNELEKAGVIVMSSNAEASQLVGHILNHK